MLVVCFPMDSAPEIQSVDSLEEISEGLGEKRPTENGDDDELGGPATKKARFTEGLVGNMKKVAEIVLVLAAMGKMRGGRSPTPAEKDMMLEAREKLVEVCEGFAPKDVFPRDAFGTVIEDLGLNKLREQRLGFRPPKVSIAEKLIITKEKMEKSEDFPLHSAPSSAQRSQVNLGAAAESRGVPLPAVRMFPSDKPIHALVSSSGFQPASALGHVSAANSPSLPYQLPTSEVRSVVSGGLSDSHLARDSSTLATSRVERLHFKLDGRSNGSSFTSQVPANSSGDHTLTRTATWSLQPQTVSSANLQLQTGSSVTSAKIGMESKVSAHASVKHDCAVDVNASRVAPQAATSKPFITPITSGNSPSLQQHVQGIHIVQDTSTPNSHNEIGKIVQKLLQPHLPEHPTWTPPSRDYMNKALVCQMCKLTINEVDTVLVCDACERGYHLKCLQSCNQKVIPRGEWHCHKCLALSNGKPLPPKYGRVMRNITTPKLPPTNTPAARLPVEKTVGTLNEKFNQQKVTENGNSSLHIASSGTPAATTTDTTGNNSSHSTSVLTMENVHEIQGNDVLSNADKFNENPPSGACSNNLLRTSGLSGVSHSTDSSCERSSTQELVSEAKPGSPVKHETIISLDTFSKDSCNSQDIGKIEPPNEAEGLAKQQHENRPPSEDANKFACTENLDFNMKDENKQQDQSIAQSDSVEVFGAKIEHAGSSTDIFYDVDWIGDILQVVEEKTYYQSCCINGIVYRVHDHALFHYNGRPVPFKLQAMWDDSKSRSKCVSASQCYFPCDLPNDVGRPCSPESNEVYESNHNSTLMAGMIQGPCEVLPPNKFIEESERKKRAWTRTNNQLQPVFLCKWFYDELKGLFRDVTS